MGLRKLFKNMRKKVRIVKFKSKDEFLCVEVFISNDFCKFVSMDFEVWCMLFEDFMNRVLVWLFILLFF